MDTHIMLFHTELSLPIFVTTTEEYFQVCGVAFVLPPAATQAGEEEDAVEVVMSGLTHLRQRVGLCAHAVNLEIMGRLCPDNLATHCTFIKLVGVLLTGYGASRKKTIRARAVQKVSLIV